MIIICSFLTFVLSYGEANKSPISSNKTYVSLNEDSNATLSCTFDESAYHLHCFLWMCIGCTEADTIKPLSPNENRHAGDSVTLSCSYKDYTGTVQSLQWYRQYPRSKPEFLLYIFEHGAMSEDIPHRFSAEVNKDNKQVDLKISSAVETDSAMYYCALVPTVTGNLTASYKNLLCQN
ncbi:hypothetical protein QQF64_015157 [Cirrhinus molitorella]|uniref:Ig-like domain-containing protein n=1 Tax=Cirrhinus molitorella TaxID=172907 RepID=A0ABR3NUX1_9TELE